MTLNCLGNEIIEIAGNAELVLVHSAPSDANKVYTVEGIRNTNDGILYIFRHGGNGVRASAVSFKREVSLYQPSPFDEFKKEAQDLCSPIDVEMELLAIEGDNEQTNIDNACDTIWRVQLIFSTPIHALSKTKVNILAERVRTVNHIPIPQYEWPPCRRTGLTVRGLYPILRQSGSACHILIHIKCCWNEILVGMVAQN